MDFALDMAGKDQDYRIFVGGLSWDITERQLEDAFSRFGKILDCQVSYEFHSFKKFASVFNSE